MCWQLLLRHEETSVVDDDIGTRQEELQAPDFAWLVGGPRPLVIRVAQQQCSVRDGA